MLVYKEAMAHGGWRSLKVFGCQIILVTKSVNIWARCKSSLILSSNQYEVVRRLPNNAWALEIPWGRTKGLCVGNVHTCEVDRVICAIKLHPSPRYWVHAHDEKSMLASRDERH